MKRKTKIEWPKPLAWKQTGDHDWTSDEEGTRIRRLTNGYLGIERDDYSTYRRGLYLGTRQSLKIAKELVERDPRGQAEGQ